MLAALALSSCAQSGPIEVPLTRSLPPEPSFAQQVHVAHSENEDPLIAAGRERAGRARANEQLKCFTAWYRQVRADFGSEQAERGSSTALQNCTGK